MINIVMDIGDKRNHIALPFPDWNPSMIDYFKELDYEESYIKNAGTIDTEHLVWYFTTSYIEDSSPYLDTVENLVEFADTIVEQDMGEMESIIAIEQLCKSTMMYSLLEILKMLKHAIGREDIECYFERGKTL